MNPSERRQYKRINKNFVVSYYSLATADLKYQATQIKNVSLGGVCLITEKSFPSESKIGIELRTSILAEPAYLEGVVLESHERIKGVIYETRIKFSNVPPSSEFVLTKLIEHFGKEEGPK